MSGHYSAGQYNDSFGAKRLRNWQYGVQHPGKYCARRACPRPTQYIADDRGHLLPHIPRNPCCSPWGDYRGYIWEESGTKCECIDRIRNPQDYDRPPCDVLVAKQQRDHCKQAKRTSAELAKMLFQPPPPPEVKVISIDPEDSSKAQQSENGKGREGGFGNQRPCSKASSTESLINRIKMANKTENEQSGYGNGNNSCCGNTNPNDSANNNQVQTQYEQTGPAIEAIINPLTIPNGLNFDVDASQTTPGTSLLVNIDTGDIALQNQGQC